MNLWYTWIMQQRPRSLKSFWTLSWLTIMRTMPMFTVVCIPWLSVQQLLTKLVVKSFVSLSMLNQPKRSFLPVERRQVLTGLVVLQSRFLSQEMRWLFQLWNTTRISYLGRKLVRRRGLNLYMPT